MLLGCGDIMNTKMSKNLTNYRSEIDLSIPLPNLSRDQLFDFIIEDLGDKVYYLAYKITRSHAEAEDIFQEVFLIVYNKIYTLRNLKALPSWLYKITINIANLKIRNKKREQKLFRLVEYNNSEQGVLKGVDFTNNGMNSLLRKEAQTVIKKAINDLPEQYQNVVVLSDLENLSLAKTSELLNISISATKSRLHRARQKLKGKLRSYFLDKAN